MITTAIKAGVASVEVAGPAVDSMTRLNDVGASVAADGGATGCTDVTGFGLVGHLGRMARESSVTVTVEFDAIPFLPGAVDLPQEGIMPGGGRRNLAWGKTLLDPGSHDELDQLLVADAQTSGGLVFGVDPGETSTVLAALAATDHDAAPIGSTSVGDGGLKLR